MDFGRFRVDFFNVLAGFFGCAESWMGYIVVICCLSLNDC